MKAKVYGYYAVFIEILVLIITRKIQKILTLSICCNNIMHIVEIPLFTKGYFKIPDR